MSKTLETFVQVNEKGVYMLPMVQNRYFVIESIVDEKKLYFSHWERLHPTSQAFGIVWNEYLWYCHKFSDKNGAELTIKAIVKFDPKTMPKIVPVNKDLIKKSFEKVANIKIND